MDLNKLYLGDCLHIMNDIPDKSIDLVVTDPPYEFAVKTPRGGGFMRFKNIKHLDKIDKKFGMSYDPKIYLNKCKRILIKFNGYFFTNKNLLYEYITFARENGYKWDLIIFAKTNPVPIFNGHYMRDKEYLVYIKEKGAYFNSKLGYSHYFSVKRFPIGQNKTGHPAEKPIELIKNAILVSSKKDNIIFDGYSGSGTTAIACIRTNRNYICVEKDPEYFMNSNKRIAEEKSKNVIKLMEE